MSGVRRKRSSITKSAPSSKRPSTNIDFALNGKNYNDNNDDDDDDMIDSGDEESIMSGDGDGGDNDIPSSDEEDKETVDEKRVRLARAYLSKMEQEEKDDEDNDSSSAVSTDDSSNDMDSDDEVEEKDRIGRRLQRERLKKQGVLERLLAKKVQLSLQQKWKSHSDNNPKAKVSGATVDINADAGTGAGADDAKTQANTWVQNNQYKLCRGHDLTPTCVALHTPSGSKAYSASKDNSIIMWDVESQSRLYNIAPKWNPNKCDYTRNSGEVLSMAASDDGRYLAVGGRDATVKIYDVRQKKTAVSTTTATATATGSIDAKKDFEIRGLATTFEGHKGPVTALAFRSKSLQMFSGSDDRCIRHYNLQELTYIETLYGHQAAVSGISCHGIRNEVPFSVGRDRTARAWKLAEETHLIFRGGAKLSSADCISSMKDDWFMTGHDDGVLNLWLISKKRAADSIKNAHGFHGSGGTGLPRGIVSCASVGGSDLAITGSNDGYMRLWNVSTGDTNKERGIEPIGKIPINGYINDIAIGPKARFCVAAVGQEPRLGRWDRIPSSKNRFAIIPLRESGDDNDNDDEDGDDVPEEAVSDDETPVEDLDENE